MKIRHYFYNRIALGLVTCGMLLHTACNAEGKKNNMNTFAKTESRIEQPSNMASQPVLPLFYRALVPFSKKEHAQLAFPVMPAQYTFAAKTNVIPLLVTETGRAEAHYPIVFMQTGEQDVPALVVLVGLAGENRYVDSNGQWMKGAYIPAWIRRYPFLAVQTEEKEEPMLAIDPSYAFLNAKGGPAFFDKDGNGTERLRNMLNFNVVYQQDAKRTYVALDVLKQSGVLEPATLQLRSAKDSEQKNFTGFWVVNEKRLTELADDQIIKLQRTGALGLAYAQMLSMRNIKYLLD